MATIAMVPVASWPQRIWMDLQPTPGRLSASLRIVLASIITLIVLHVFQVPFASIALYFVFIVGRDSPSVSLRSGVMSLLTLVASVATELGVVALSDNDPMARVISVAVVSFLAGMLVVATTVPVLASTWGFIFCTLIALWERHAPEDTLVKGSLWILAAIAIAISSSIAVEYIFGSRNPALLLTEERRMRYRSLIEMFTLYAEGAEPAVLQAAVTKVSRIAVAGQSGMQRLYNSIVDRSLDAGSLPIGARVRITMIAQLMDVSATFGFQNHTADDPEIRRRCARIAAVCKVLLQDATMPDDQDLLPVSEHALTLLDRVEENLRVIYSMPHDFSPERDKNLVALPSKKVSLLIPGALRQRSTWIFGFKISLCATLCYILYFALDWPGISTSVTTVLITGLSTTGAFKQKVIFRFAGSLIGGLILGLGCTAFVFPEMDSITALTVLVAILAFASAWIAGGRQFSYVGLQIIFSFYLVAFEDFHAPTQLAPARDRLIGILLALIVMWFVFDQMWPVRTVTAMCRSFASILQSEASLFRTELATPPHDEMIRQTDALRDHIGKTMAGIRSMNETVEYEFGVDRQQHINVAQQILRAALVAVALVWNELTILHSEQDADFLSQSGLRDLRKNIALQLDALAASVVGQSSAPAVSLPVSVDAEILQHPRYGEYMRQTLARYEELRSLLVEFHPPR
ncbi:FUSC family protein [Acidicapsa ligni]|uniref:FUSC family protein n=1 Tax=Acidicapsa ligni TaxID=542300 RepID=UPI0021E087BD|nr:FUSC family protein [Acidicapsa ligni]